jgi:hypothetical protein
MQRHVNVNRRGTSKRHSRPLQPDSTLCDLHRIQENDPTRSGYCVLVHWLTSLGVPGPDELNREICK